MTDDTCSQGDDCPFEGMTKEERNELLTKNLTAINDFLALDDAEARIMADPELQRVLVRLHKACGKFIADYEAFAAARAEAADA